MEELLLIMLSYYSEIEDRNKLIIDFKTGILSRHLNNSCCGYLGVSQHGCYGNFLEHSPGTVYVSLDELFVLGKLGYRGGGRTNYRLLIS